MNLAQRLFTKSLAAANTANEHNYKEITSLCEQAANNGQFRIVYECDNLTKELIARLKNDGLNITDLDYEDDDGVSYATDEKPPGIGEYVLSLFFGPVALTFFILYTVFELLLDIKLLSKYPVTVSIVMFTIIALVCHIIYVTWLI